MSFCKCSKMTWAIYCLVILGVLLIVLAIILPIYIESVIKSKAEDQVIMGTQNFQLWGVIPGQSEVDMKRFYYLYNLSNPDDFLYNDAKPEFIEVGPYVYDEYQNYTNLNFSSNVDTHLEEIHYKFWQYYLHRSGNTQDTINSLNLGSLGVWNQAKNVPKNKMALQIFSSMILSMENELMLVGLSQGIQSFIQNKNNLIQTIFKPSRIPPNLYDALWDDDEYGWKNSSTLRTWISASQTGIYSGASVLLKDHFHLSFSNMYSLLSGPLSNWISTTQSMLKNWYCPNRISCDERYLAVLQITQQGMTLNPPAGSNGTKSIMSTNDTLRSFPEISLFLKEIFLLNPEINISAYENITFSVEWGYKLFNHSNSNDNEWMKDNDILLHVGNLDFIFKQGVIFEKSKSLKDLEQIKERFHLESLEHTHVFYSYLNYMVDEFGIQKSKNGTSGQAFMASLVSTELYKQYNNLNDYLLKELLANVILYNIQIKNITCEVLFNESGLNQSDYEKLCSENQIFSDNWFTDTKSVKFLLDICEIRNGIVWQNFSKMSKLNKVDLMILCESNNPNEASFFKLKSNAESRIHSYYNCTQNNFSCTKKELSRRQWGNSSITQNPLPELLSISSSFKKTLTVKDWNPSLFVKPFEYFSVLSSHRNFTSNGDIIGFDEISSKKLLSFDRLFGQAIRYLFTDYENKDYEKVKETFLTNDGKALQSYIKYIMIEFALQGFVHQRSIQELLWGYQDPLLSIASKTNPINGGDPSINPNLALATNSTYEDALKLPQSVYSGKGDPSKTRVYTSVYDIDYITYKDVEFDGNQTYDIYHNPWEEKVPYSGTDSFCNPPGTDENSKIQIYMADACYGGPADYSGEKIDHNGLNTLRFITASSFMQNKTNIPEYGKYYMDKWNQALNATSFKKMPIFLTKFRYLDLDPEPIQDLVIYTNDSKVEKVKADKKYETHIDVEPYTGGAVSASLNIHSSFEYQGDELFSNKKYIFLPILGIVRPGTWSDSAIDSIYGDLILAIKLKRITFIVGLSIGIFFIVAGVVLIIIKWRTYQKKKSNCLLEKNLKDTDIDTNKEEDLLKT